MDNILLIVDTKNNIEYDSKSHKFKLEHNVKSGANIAKHAIVIDDKVIVKKYFTITFLCTCGKTIMQKYSKCVSKIIHQGLLCSVCARKKYFMKNYGVENAQQIPEVQNKTKATIKKKYGRTGFGSDKYKIAMIKKYGNENPYKFGSDKFKSKMKEKYGVENSQQMPSTQKKSKQTKKKKYGNESYCNPEKAKHTKKIRYGDSNYCNVEKAKKTKKKKYGNEYYCNPEKIKHTNKLKYGVEYSFQSDRVKNKIKKTLIEKYGVDNPGKSHVIIEKGMQTYRNNYYDKMINKFSEIVMPLFKKEEYIDIYKKYPWKCSICNTEFEDDLQIGHIPRCPQCHPKHGKTSSLEKEVADFIESLGIDIIRNTNSIIKPFELDIYIPDHNLAIEFDGLYWHSELQGKGSRYHLNKTRMCQEKEIHLMHIFEDEWIEKKEIVKSIIKAKLNKYDTVIHGRKCSIAEIESSDFFDKNHIQGKLNSSVNLGLQYNGEIISVMSFSKNRYSKKYEWELTRFANTLNTKVHGSFSKLLHYFIEEYNPKTIITYADIRLFDGNVYKNNGFIYTHTAKPDYYYTDYKYRYHRMQFQKKMLQDKLEEYNPHLTEWENMQINGWDRIWNCGNLVYLLER